MKNNTSPITRVRLSPKNKNLVNFKWGMSNHKINATGRITGLRSVSFDLLAGWTCPAASLCSAKVMENKDGSHYVKKGKDSQFLCFAAKGEAVFPASYNAHKFNMDKVLGFIKKQDFDSLVNALVSDISLLNIQLIRIHSSGDLFNKFYTLAWIRVAELMPHVEFFGYTKMMNNYKLIQEAGLNNLNFAYSMGGTQDSLVEESTVTCTVCTDSSQFHKVESESDARGFHFETNEKNESAEDIVIINGKTLPVVCNYETDESESADFYMIKNRRSFSIIVH